MTITEFLTQEIAFAKYELDLFKTAGGEGQLFDAVFAIRIKRLESVLEFAKDFEEKYAITQMWNETPPPSVQSFAERVKDRVRSKSSELCCAAHNGGYSEGLRNATANGISAMERHVIEAIDALLRESSTDQRLPGADLDKLGKL